MSRIWVALALLVVPALAVAQTISSVDGSVDADSTITIIGSGFGYKSPAEPVLWDHLSNIEAYSGLSHGDVIPTQNDGNCPDCPWVARSSSTQYWDQDKRVENRPVYRMITKDKLTGENYGGDEPGVLYVNWWFKASAPIDDNSISSKFIRMWTGGSIDDGHTFWDQIKAQPFVDTAHDCNSDGVGTSWGGWGGNDAIDQWHHMEAYADGRGNVQCGYGRFVCTRNNNTVHDMEYWGARPYNALGKIGMDHSITTPYVGDTYDLSEIYVDTVLTRVALGDASSWASVSHYEMQIPTYWATDGDSVQVTVNTGTFSTDDTAYLFVFDADGNPSAGEQVTIGETYEGESPPAGQPAAPDTVYVEGVLDQ